MSELEQDVITERGARKSAGVTNFKNFIFIFSPLELYYEILKKKL